MKANERRVYAYLEAYLTAMWDAKYVDSIRGSLVASNILKDVEAVGLTTLHVRALERMTHARLHADSYDSYANYSDAIQAAYDKTKTTEGDETFVAFIDTNTGPYRRYLVLNMGVWYE